MNKTITTIPKRDFTTEEQSLENYAKMLKNLGIECSIQGRVLSATMKKKGAENPYIVLEIVQLEDGFKGKIHHGNKSDQIRINPKDAIQTFLMFKEEFSD